MTDGSHCEVCGDILVGQVDIPALTEADFAYRITFDCADGINVVVHDRQDFSDEGYETDTAYSRGKTGELLKDGEGQVNFEVVGSGVPLFDIIVTPKSYKNIKGPDEVGVVNGYRVTKITSDITIVITSDAETAAELPIVAINTQDGAPILDRINYVSCEVSIMNAEEKYCINSVGAGIRGRGNSSWKEPKKPYKVKFDSKIDLFGGGKAKKWVLLSDFGDGSMLRNYVTYDIASALLDDLKYTTVHQPVELFLNSEYLGVYLLCEDHEVNTNRVEISEDITDADGAPLLDTGYLLEMDLRAPGEGGTEGIHYFYVDGVGFPFAVKSPEIEDITAAGLDPAAFTAFIKAKIEGCFSAFGGSDYAKVAELVDVKSFVDGYIIDELVNLSDKDHSSFFVYYDSNDKLVHRGPIWDYNGSLGNAGNTAGGNNPEFLYAGTGISWYRSLLAFDEFKAAVGARLEELRKNNRFDGYVDGMIAKISLFHAAFERNYVRWDSLANYNKVISNSMAVAGVETLESWQDQVLYIKCWLHKSFDFLCRQYCTAPEPGSET